MILETPLEKRFLLSYQSQKCLKALILNVRQHIFNLKILLNKDELINFPSDGADGAFNPDEIQRPPVRTSFWELEDDVVCSQPSRNLSRPDGLEDPEDSNVS